uniref:Uncharacterized protein n=1 Tax=Solanum lycopersicum TaxID=4081 RepID=A0A3Q7IEJ9_SOLLC
MSQYQIIFLFLLYLHKLFRIPHFLSLHVTLYLSIFTLCVFLNNFKNITNTK